MYPTVLQAHDDQLRQRVIEFLASRGITCLERLEVNVVAAVVEVRGRAGSEQEKQLCLECCRHVAGVVRVVDRLTVKPANNPATSCFGQESETLQRGVPPKDTWCG